MIKSKREKSARKRINLPLNGNGIGNKRISDEENIRQIGIEMI